MNAALRDDIADADCGAAVDNDIGTDALGEVCAGCKIGERDVAQGRSKDSLARVDHSAVDLAILRLQHDVAELAVDFAKLDIAGCIDGHAILRVNIAGRDLTSRGLDGRRKIGQDVPDQNIAVRDELHPSGKDRVARDRTAVCEHLQVAVDIEVDRLDEAPSRDDRVPFRKDSADVDKARACKGVDAHPSVDRVEVDVGRSAQPDRSAGNEIPGKQAPALRPKVDRSRRVDRIGFDPSRCIDQKVRSRDDVGACEEIVAGAHGPASGRIATRIGRVRLDRVRDEVTSRESDAPGDDLSVGLGRY